MPVYGLPGELGQAVPVLGIFVGAGLNYNMLDDICDAAYWAYRERFLHDKRGDGWEVTLPSPPPSFDSDVESIEEPEVSIIDMLGTDGPTELESVDANADRVEKPKATR
jgi:hypothetical protein